jgi:hypothetical protein
LPNEFLQVAAGNRPAAGSQACTLLKGELMKRMIMLLVLGAFAFAIVGCEAHAKVNDNGAKAGVNVDK